MSNALRALRERYIVGLAVIPFGGGFFLASHQNSPSMPVTAKDAQSPGHGSADRRGLVGVLSVEGPPNPDIYNGQVMPGMGTS